jgi:hypothetical protein
LVAWSLGRPVCARRRRAGQRRLAGRGSAHE